MKTSSKLLFWNENRSVKAFSQRLFVAFLLAAVACSPPPGVTLTGENSGREENENYGEEEDAGQENDAGQESCVEVCGDVNQDGVVNLGDVLRLEGHLAGTLILTACEEKWADVTGDGVLDEQDLEMVSKLVTGAVEGGCEACSRTCGDVNGDGSIDILDVSAAIGIAEGAQIPTVCDFLTTDVKRDGVLDRADAQAIGWTIMDGENTTGQCEPCDRICGDVNGDGSVGLSDVNALTDIIAGTTPLETICDLWAADVNADGQVDILDQTMLHQIFASANEGMGCHGGDPFEMPTNPQINLLSLNGEQDDIEIYSGEDIEVQWASEHTDSCQASGTLPGWTGAKNTSGQESLNTAYELAEGSYTIELACEGQGETTSRSRTVTVVDHCQAHQALPSDWNRLTTWNNSCSYRAHGLGLPGGNSGPHPDHDCRHFNQVWPYDFGFQSGLQRAIGAPGTNGGRHYVAMGFNSGDIPFGGPYIGGHYRSFSFTPPQTSNLNFGYKHISISRCPGNFDAPAIEAVMGPGCMWRTSAAGPRVGGLHFETHTSVCALESHTDYYLNIIYTNQPIGTPLEDLEPPPQCIGGAGCGTRMVPPRY